MFNKTTDSILSVFTKTIKELETHAEVSYAKKLALNEKAAALQLEAKQHRDEALKASDAAAKIKAIFNGPAS